METTGDQEYTYEYYEEDVDGGHPTAGDNIDSSIIADGGGGGSFIEDGAYEASIGEYDEYTEDIGKFTFYSYFKYCPKVVDELVTSHHLYPIYPSLCSDVSM